MTEEYDPVPPFAATPVAPPVVCGHVLTIDEIVGRLVGYEPQEMPYYEVLDAAIEQAGFEHQKAEIAGTAADQLEALQARIDNLGRLRRDAILFDRELKEVAAGRTDDYLRLSTETYSDGLPRFITTSVYIWAKEVLARKIPEWAPLTFTPEEATEQPNSPVRTSTPDRGWAAVSIQLLTNNRIRYQIGTRRPITKPLSETLFVDKRKSEVTTNDAYQQLTWIAGQAYFGKGRVASGADKAKRDKLCKALADLVGIGGNPFTERSPREGYKPHFTVENLSDKLEQSGEWYMNHEVYDPNRDYDANDEHKNEDEDEDEDNYDSL